MLINEKELEALTKIKPLWENVEFHKFHRFIDHLSEEMGFPLSESTTSLVNMKNTGLVVFNPQ